MPTFISPTGNPEVWETKPKEYFTPEEWAERLYDDMPIETGKQIVKAKVTDKRWQVETNGITLSNGVEVASSIADQNRIATSIQGMETADINEIDFKASSGWVKLTLDDLKTISIAITKHVEACFARECALHTLCDKATTVTELIRIRDEELNTGWPTYEKLV